MVGTNKLSQAYTSPDIAAKQRVIVDRQLREMHAGNAPAHFAVVGEIMAGLHCREGTEPITLLDAGCSSSYYHEIVEYYVPGWAQYTGVDYNPSMVDMSRARYPESVIVRGDLQRLGFADRAFDMVLSGGTLVHIKNWQLALSELARVARRWLLLHRTWVYLDKPTRCRASNAYGHEVWDHYLNQGELVQLVEDMGLKMFKNCHAGEGPLDDTEGWSVRTHLFERQ